MLEKDFGKSVESIFTTFGWTWKHDLPAVMQSGKWATPLAGKRGFPDYIAVRGERIVCAELKNEKGRLRPDQRQWIEILKMTGKVEVYVWRPSDWKDLIEILR